MHWALSKLRRRTAVALITLSLLVADPYSARGWGHRAHELVNAAAVENLPEPLRSYFRIHEEYLVAHASDPDLLSREDENERPHHFTEVEAYDRYPFGEF